MIEEKKENVKDLLKEYSKTKFELFNLEAAKEELLTGGYDTSITASYGAAPGGGNGINDKVFNAISKKEKEIDNINKLISSKKAFIKMLEELVTTLNYKEQVIVKKHAFENKDFVTITKELKCMHDIDIYNNCYCKDLYYSACKKMQHVLDDTHMIISSIQ